MARPKALILFYLINKKKNLVNLSKKLSSQPRLNTAALCCTQVSNEKHKTLKQDFKAQILQTFIQCHRTMVNNVVHCVA